ncbi:MAG: c-type cytochrome [Verrucomicrobia bacterium]|nr:c-type cytochrome [Verrucomicrobiota bacterium]
MCQKSIAFILLKLAARAIDMRWRVWVRCSIFCASFALNPVAFAAADPFSENVRTTEPAPGEQELKSFRLPPGFEMQLVATEPDINKPMNMAFDAKGRLWVTTSREYPFPAPLDKPARDRVMIFEDFGPDGRARKVTQFADGLNIPIGIYPHGDGCIVWSIPNIWFLHDTDGDGKADKKEILYGPFDHTRDTHGNQASFRRGFDGWLYATHGYNNDSHVTARDGSHVDLNSGNTYRMRLDGSRIEQHTHGQVNPFGLAWDAAGNLYSSDCHSAPTYQLLAGGYYPSFGKPHDGLGFAPVLMEHSHGSTAIGGMVFYADDLWPEEFQNNTFIGNVMTSRVNRDRLTFNGSSPHANELDDFVKCDDPWFRPVDNLLGPDGAFYIADFYNRIIGHYEVPLLHPGRDRERGRIWRVVYKGPDGKPKLRPAALPQDLDGLIQELRSPSLARRMLAMNEIQDRFGKDAAQPVKRALNASKAVPLEHIHDLWLLNRLDALDDAAIESAAANADASVRVHAQRVLAERGLQAASTLKTSERENGLKTALRAVVVTALNDKDGLVQRCAAEALGAWPSFDNVGPLLNLRAKVPSADTHLLHVVRKALRDQLKADGVLARLQKENLSETDSRALADVAVAVPSADAGEFLLRHIEKYSEDKQTLSNYLRHIARYAPATKMDSLADFTRKKFPDDLDFQLALFQSIQQGTEQRGAALGDPGKQWGADLAAKLLDSTDATALDWTSSPLPGAPTANPWFVQKRNSADGDQGSPFLCSLPPGGERLTGTLRSKSFTVPARLKFFLAGHDGFPDQPALKKNVVRLRSTDGQGVLAETFAPRNDLAQAVTWDLAAHAGRQAFIEVTDAVTESAYAWLAVGRFEPAVVTVPAVSPNSIGLRQQAAAELVRTLPVPALQGHLVKLLTSAASELETRGAAARTLASFTPSEPRVALAAIVNDAAVSENLRTKIVAALVEKKPDVDHATLIEALRTTPNRLQIKLAQTLAGNTAGAEQLLSLVKDGKASASLLQQRAVKNQVIAAKPDNAAARIAELVKSVPSANEVAQKLIDQRRAAYDPTKASPARGEQIFTQNCRICHQIDGVGTVVGPQLDGIGNRGLERVLEDVLDPNRNVDPAFHTTIIELKDDEAVSGLFRREEGEAVVLAIATGQEVTIPKKNIVDRRALETSLMPENFGELIPAEEFNHLIGFLLSKAGKPSQ